MLKTEQCQSSIDGNLILLRR